MIKEAEGQSVGFAKAGLLGPGTVLAGFVST